MIQVLTLPDQGMQLVNTLGILLGFDTLIPIDMQRSLQLPPYLSTTDSFWKTSLEHDALGTALRLLRWIEGLQQSGWKGEGASTRLRELAQLMEHALPGRVDRIEKLIQALKVQTCDIDRIELVGYERRYLPLLHRRLLEAVERHVCVVKEVPLEQVEQAGDLAGCLVQDYIPSGSGELQLIRPQGPISAAEAVAVWLAGLDDFSGTIIIGGDEVLDAALHRHGLPVLGKASGTAGDALLQILPLVLAVSWEPQDPRAMQELLSLDISPIPSVLAKLLLRALVKWPAVGSEDWERAIESGLAGIKDEEHRRRVEERLEILLSPCAAGDEFPLAVLEGRVSALIKWMRGRRAGAGDQEGRWTDALQQVTTFQELCRATGLESLNRPLLDRLVRCATEQVGRRPRREAQAGLEGVPEPGDVVSPVRRVIWWNFTERSAPSVRRIILSPLEKKELAEAGVELPDPGQKAEQLAELWRRPLQMASEAALLICPRFGADGEEEAPHPLWDEITAGLDSPQVARLERDLPQGIGPTRSVPALAMAQPRAEWRLERPEALRLPEVWSPKSLYTLIGNPLYWVLEKQARFDPGTVQRLPSDVLLKGRLLHWVMENLLGACIGGGITDPDGAALEGERLFLERGPRLAAEYFQPGRYRERGRLQRDIRESVRDLFRYLEAMGGHVEGVEEVCERELDGVNIRGRLDLRLASPRLVLDIKLGGRAARRRELTEGGSLQPALYALLTDPEVAYGYYIIFGRRLLILGNVPGCSTLEGPGARETWDGARTVLRQRLEQIRAGVVMDVCADADGHQPPERSRLMDGRLELAVNPAYSPYAWLSRGQDSS